LDCPGHPGGLSGDTHLSTTVNGGLSGSRGRTVRRQTPRKHTEKYWFWTHFSGEWRTVRRYNPRLSAGQKPKNTLNRDSFGHVSRNELWTVRGQGADCPQYKNQQLQKLARNCSRGPDCPRFRSRTVRESCSSKNRELRKLPLHFDPQICAQIFTNCYET
jgi:hypothetical protein